MPVTLLRAGFLSPKRAKPFRFRTGYFRDEPRVCVPSPYGRFILTYRFTSGRDGRFTLTYRFTSNHFGRFTVDLPSVPDLPRTTSVDLPSIYLPYPIYLEPLVDLPNRRFTLIYFRWSNHFVDLPSIYLRWSNHKCRIDNSGLL